MKVDLSGPTTSIENGEAAGSKLGQVETEMAEHVLQLGEDVRDYARYCVELVPILASATSGCLKMAREYMQGVRKVRLPPCSETK